MKLRKAKQLIIEAASKALGFKLSSNTNIEQYLVVGVKLGKLTPEQAAKDTNNNYTKACTRVFNRVQA
tara:strand:+ start:175 stop:378 length:204 start_codon:yes stop_codon:yes gene_type:complete